RHSLRRDLESAFGYGLQSYPGIRRQCGERLIYFMCDRRRDFSSRSQAQGTIESRLLIAQARRGMLTLGNNGSDDEARNCERDHKDLECTKPRIGPEADLCTDNEADLDEREGHRRARRPVRERDPKKREKQ